MTTDVQHLLVECQRIEENSLYTAQAHFEIATSTGRRKKVWLQFLPSLVGAGCGLAVAIGAPPWIAAFSAFAGVVSAVATFLGVEKEAGAHEAAGKLLTQLRDEARALREAYSPALTQEQFSAEVRALGNRYRAYVASLPLTNDAAFERGRKKIKDQAFQFDAQAPAVPPTTAAPSLPASSSADKR
jgi:hypothetical protein